MRKLRIGIVGGGRMGRIRAHSAQCHPSCEVVLVTDVHLAHAQALAAEHGCMASTDWTEVVTRNDIDTVVVATPPKYLAAISTAALEAGKSVLCEKPGARTAAEAEAVLRVLYGSWPPSDASTPPVLKRGSAQLVMGFTLRHHHGIARARELLASGEIGRPMYLVGRYGHGGRPGYEQEWRARRDLAGGGELLDQGVHLIDLSRWFLGNFEEVTGFVGTYFWKPNPSIENNALEDNAFLLLRSAQGHVASLHASWTQWKNLFGFEVYGETGFLQIHGLGGNYGEEELLVGRRNLHGGIPETKRIDISPRKTAESQDDVWAREWQSFVNVVLDRDPPTHLAEVIQPASAIDAWQALRIVEAAYDASRTGANVPLRATAAPVSHRSPAKALAASSRVQIGE